MKYQFFSLFIFISTILCAQTPNLNKISEQFQLDSIINYTNLNSNGIESAQIFFALHFADSSTKIYDLREDTVSSESYKGFRINPKCCGYSFISLIDDSWVLLKEDWITQNDKIKRAITTIGRFPINKVDSIIQLDYDMHFGLLKNDTLHIIRYDSSLRYLAEIYNVKNYLNSFDGGVFVTSNKNKVVHLDFITGMNNFKFEVDSIYNIPDSFNPHSLIKKNGSKSVYSFETNKIIESDFEFSYVVPVYDFPLILNDNYIAYGGRDWHKIKFKKADNVEFIVNGDLVIGVISSLKGERLKINLWNDEVLK